MKIAVFRPYRTAIFLPAFAVQLASCGISTRSFLKRRQKNGIPRFVQRNAVGDGKLRIT